MTKSMLRRACRFWFSTVPTSIGVGKVAEGFSATSSSFFQSLADAEGSLVNGMDHVFVLLSNVPSTSSMPLTLLIRQKMVEALPPVRLKTTLPVALGRNSNSLPVRFRRRI